MLLWLLFLYPFPALGDGGRARSFRSRKIVKSEPETVSRKGVAKKESCAKKSAAGQDKMR